MLDALGPPCLSTNVSHHSQCMRISHLITVAALMAAFVIGCSKHPKASSLRLPADTKYLGVIKLTENTPQHFSIGSGKSCTVTGRQVPDGINIEVIVVATNATGTVSRSQAELTSESGHQCAICIGEDSTTIALTPILEKP